MDTKITQPEKATSSARGGRVFKGTVVKSAMKDTTTVSIRRFVKHKKYGKYIKREKKFLVHDVGNTAKVGDVVLIQETKPISKNKHFVLLNTVTRAAANEE
jgi:small subunit ribosomal protein S17